MSIKIYPAFSDDLNHSLSVQERRPSTIYPAGLVQAYQQEENTLSLCDRQFLPLHDHFSRRKRWFYFSVVKISRVFHRCCKQLLINHLLHASRKNNLVLAHTLIKQMSQRECDLCIRPLLYAILRNKLTIAFALIMKMTPSALAIPDRLGNTPLINALLKKQDSLIGPLIDRMPPQSFAIKNSNGLTALHHTIILNREDIVLKIVSRADPSAFFIENDQSETPIQMVSSNPQHKNIIRAMLLRLDESHIEAHGSQILPMLISRNADDQTILILLEKINSQSFHLQYHFSIYLALGHNDTIASAVIRKIDPSKLTELAYGPKSLLLRAVKSQLTETAKLILSLTDTASLPLFGPRALLTLQAALENNIDDIAIQLARLMAPENFISTQPSFKHTPPFAIAILQNKSLLAFEILAKTPFIEIKAFIHSVNVLSLAQVVDALSVLQQRQALNKEELLRIFKETFITNITPITTNGEKANHTYNAILEKLGFLGIFFYGLALKSIQPQHFTDTIHYFEDPILALTYSAFLSPEILFDFKLHLIKMLPPEDFVLFLNILFQYPQIMTPLYPFLFQLSLIEIHDGGNAYSSWPKLTREAIKTIACLPPIDEDTDFERELTASIPPTISWGIPYQEYTDLLNEGWSVVKTLGRTLLFKNGNQYLALKIQRQEEDLSKLFEEFGKTKFFYENGRRLGLQSQWPKPLGVLKTCNIPLEVMDSLSVPTQPYDDDVYCTYCYQFSNDSYFVYLHDERLTDSQFTAARRTMLHDLFALARRGLLYTALADIFHSKELTHIRPEAGRYIVMTEILRYILSRAGSGRLTNLWGAIEYINARLSGLADLADTELLKKLLEIKHEKYGQTRLKHPIAQRHFSEGLHLGKERFPIALLLNFLAEYLLIDQIILGKRHRHELDWRNETKCLQLAHELQESFTWAFAAYTQHPEYAAERFAKHCGVDWTMLARQMSFWMRNDDKGYRDAITEGNIPPGIFRPEVTVTIQATPTFRGWHPQLGFAIDDKNPDLGNVNGQNPIKEGEAAQYLAALFMQTIRHADQLAAHHIRLSWQAYNISHDIALAKQECERAITFNPNAIVLYDRLIQLYSEDSTTPTILSEKVYKQRAILKIQRFMRKWHKKQDFVIETI